jgi:hypothetical protein
MIKSDSDDGEHLHPDLLKAFQMIPRRRPRANPRDPYCKEYQAFIDEILGPEDKSFMNKVRSIFAKSHKTR